MCSLLCPAQFELFQEMTDSLLLVMGRSLNGLERLFLGF